MSNRSKWSLIGIPDHEGVLNVGGRIGAARGPECFRKVFSRLTGRNDVRESMLDLGDVLVDPKIEMTHRQAADRIAAACKTSTSLVVIGGGHDHGYSHLLGVAQSLKSGMRLGCLNIDAHLDVRNATPVITSGSPFYLAIENKVVEPAHFVEFGIQSHCNGKALWDYIDAHKIEVVGFEKLRGGKAVGAFAKALQDLSARVDVIAISLDLDAAAEAFAPGVSAPQAEGFTGSEIIEMMEVAGREKKATSLGIFELNPEHDIDLRTARLAATAAFHFIEARSLG